MSFGHALYYPYIHLTDENWLKYAFLFWDKISRIVPSNYKTTDSKTVSKLQSETSFIQDYHPEQQDINSAFIEFIKAFEHIPDSSRIFKSFHVEYHHFFDSESYSNPPTHEPSMNINIEKSCLEKKLKNHKLYVPADQFSNLLRINSDIGSMYMRYLANLVATKMSVPLVTDRTRYYINDNIDFHHAFEEKLGCLMIDVVMPKNINSVTMEQLINIRNKYDDQRLNFFNKINELSSTLPNIDNKSALEDALNHYIKTLANDTKELKKVYESNGIEAMLKPLAISMPTALASLSSWIPAENKILGFGIGGIGALYGVVSYFNELDRRHRETQQNPMAYLLSIQSELDKKGLLQKIEQKLSGRYR